MLIITGAASVDLLTYNHTWIQTGKFDLPVSSTTLSICLPVSTEGKLKQSLCLLFVAERKSLI